MLRQIGGEHSSCALSLFRFNGGSTNNPAMTGHDGDICHRVAVSTDCSGRQCSNHGDEQSESPG